MIERDFTYEIYEELIDAYIKSSYHLTSYEAFVNEGGDYSKRTVILRHDVDKRPQHALDVARIEHSKGVIGTYYFRVVPESFDEAVIREIAALGHEIGYHYEDLTIFKGDFKAAIKHFDKWLARFRTYYPIRTICMHGSPLSKWDNRGLWEKYDYRSRGLIAEPYFDMNFDRAFYISDTGRSWNNTAVSVRDKVESSYDLNIRSTRDVIELTHAGEMPSVVMQNVHPQRWTNNYVQWSGELIVQNIKNMVKWVIVNR